MEGQSFDTDFLVIGSGFGGSVSAMRLTEKGYRVIIAEQGKHISPETMPKTVRDIKQFLWLPALKYKGFFSLQLFKHVMVLHGNAVGGGSITYANTLLQPEDKIWQQGSWAGLHDWQAVMPQHYETAKRMLGVSQNKKVGNADLMLQKMANLSGVGDSFYLTDVGAYFSEHDKYAHPPVNGDPYFGGAGPKRSPCIGCGGCMVGCRYGAKNTLDKNYLYFAQKNGATLLAETKVTDIVPIADASKSPSDPAYQNGSQGYRVTLQSADKGEYQITTQQIVLSASSLGSQKLLFEQRHKGNMPHISPYLGKRIYTNAESLLGVRFLDDQHGAMSDGVAIGSGIYLGDGTHIEATRYPEGFNIASFLATLSNYKNGKKMSLLAWLWCFIVQFIVKPRQAWRAFRPHNMAKQSLILLCMQSTPYALEMRYQKSPWWRAWLGSRYQMQTHGPAIPAFIPAASAFAEQMATQMGGVGYGVLSEVFLNIPTTAHCMGGISLGNSAADGVVDKYHRLFNYQGFYVCDGGNISTNLGVNPSLTITALTEHAMSHIPHKSTQSPYPADTTRQNVTLVQKDASKIPA